MAMIPGDESVLPGTLSGEIYAALVTEFGTPTPVGLDNARKDFCKVIAQAVVSHITANAAVTVTVTSVSGVTTGAGTSGPGTGTGTIA
jgi:hypothetical protein